jgi:predicted metal-dependent hydrolase
MQRSVKNVFGRRGKNTRINRAHPLLLGKYDVTLGESTISFTLKRSFRARLIWMRIQQGDGLTVTVPYHYNLKKLPEYLKSNSPWILRNLHKRCNEIPASPAVGTHPANTLPYLGNYVTVMQERKNSGPPSVRLKENQLIISLSASSKKPFLTELENWCRAEASRLLHAKVREFSQRMDLSYSRIFIRNQKSRWASCSFRKNLNFNWRLVMVPEAVLDYVVVHELCHLKEMNHSKSFWNLVAHYCPEWRLHRKWLNNHCDELKVSLTNLTPAVN